jgi:PadR family transcriptional regulator
MPRRDSWNEQLRRGALDFAILLAVSPEPKYGLAIIQYLEASTDLVVAEGTVYPILGRLTRDGYVRAWWVDDEGAHPRKYYQLTRTGAARLAMMTAEWSALSGKIARLIAAGRGGSCGAQ